MNITTALPLIPASPMPASDFVGRDNQQRSLIEPSPASAENGSATDKGRGSADSATRQSGVASNDSEKSKRPEEQTDPRPAEDKRPSDRTPEEQQQVEQQVRELRNRDTEVRTHEQTHAAVGGQYAGSPRYEYQRGPDGKTYAVGGEVSIDVSVVPGDPQATIQKMTVVRRAALAPAQPSSADRAIAADAAVKAAQARAELATESNPLKADEEASNEDSFLGRLTKTLEQQVGETEDSSQPDNAPLAEREKLSSAERAAMIGNFYQQRVSPSSETGFSATA